MVAVLMSAQICRDTITFERSLRSLLHQTVKFISNLIIVFFFQLKMLNYINNLANF